MRLYLSSSSLGNQPQALLPLVGDGRRVAVIANALDGSAHSTRAEGVASEVEHLCRLGFDAREVDLRQYFGNSQRLAQALAPFHLLWVRGGNAFVLRRACQLSGFDALLKQLLAEDVVAYGGNSAGVCLLAPSLRGVELVDDPSHAPEGYPAAIIWEGLGVLPYMVVPHYRSDPPAFAAAIEEIVYYYIEHHLLFKALRDGEALVVHGDQERVVS
ncbi:MAG TPA: Type 1 glutamine amidotransferase-like domain-containing protein [Ktedonobacterales bacterium]|jgi:dipeptidase E